MRLEHLALTVADRERSAAFYAAHFGFRLDDGAEVHERRAALRRAGVEEAEWQEDGRHGPRPGARPDGYRAELYVYADG